MHVPGHHTSGAEAQQSHQRSPEKRDVPPRAAHTAAAGGPVTLDDLLALQRAAGNAAVVYAIQQARAGGPRETAATVGDVLRSAGSPLAPHVRADMESRLGADFSDVRVHTGTAAQRSARDLGARAYTAGNHVVLGAGGGDQHTLAHELVHVIQQRQGPVAGTDTGTGLRVSDPGDRFEREAEATARRVLSGAPAREHDHPHSRAHAAGRAAVQRKVTAQIVAAEGDELTVDSLVTAGRPDSPHSGGTEGDHTTAYIVLTQAVRRVIKGRTAADAAAGVWGLYEEAKTLPGEALRGNLDAGRKHAKLLNDAEAELARLHELPEGRQWDMPRLQQLISEYLQYRGTLPLSTLNIKVTGKQHGKGTGESKHVGPLNRYEAGDRTVTTAAIKEAVRGLLDDGALMTYVINVEAPSDMVAPGTEEGPIDGETFENRLRTVVEQHVASVAQAFPTAVAAAWGEPKTAAEELTGEFKDRLSDAKKSAVAHYLERLRQVREGGNTALAEQYEDILRAYGQEPPAAPKEELGRGSRIKNKSKEFFSGVASSPRKIGKALGSSFRRPEQQPVDDTEQKANDVIGQESEPGVTGSRIATQLLIDEDGRITAMLSAGRAASPFPGTMGAHTTAWTAHVDFIRTRLVGRDVTAAVQQLPGLVAHVTQVAQRLAPAFTADDDTSDLVTAMASAHISEPAGGEATAAAEEVPRVDADAVQATMTRLVTAATAAVDKPVGTQAVLLQQAVGAILERLNIIPGVTRDVAATEGSGEGSYRKMLRTGKQGQGRNEKDMKQKDYQKAVFGLLDMKGDLSNEQRLALMRNHLAIIREAYPGALARAGLSADNPAKALTQWVKRGKDSEDPF